MRSLLLILIIAYFRLSANGQDIILWNDTVPLQWENFKAQEQKESPYDAETHWAVKYNTHLEHDTLVFDIFSYVETLKSWVKKDQITDDLLQHEQGHFDIGESYTRKLRKSLSVHDFTIDNLQKDIPDIYNKIMEECVEEQRKYDKETNHSKDIEEQAIWNAKIASMLNQYSDYIATTILVPLKKK